MADSKAFLAWAKEQAKAHGANSKISNLSKLGSKYSLEGFVTWGEVVAAAQRDTAEAAKPEPVKQKSSSKATNTESSRFITGQLQDLKNNLEAAKQGILSEPIGSTLYNQYKDLIPQREAEIADLTAKLNKTKASETAAGNKKDTASSIQSTKDAIQRLNEQRQRTVDLGGNTSDIDKDIADAQNKLNNLAPASTPAATETPGAPGAISGKVPAKPVVKSTSKTPGKTPNKQSGIVTPIPDDAITAAHTALQSMGTTAGGYTIQMGLIESDPSLKELFYNDVYLPISQGKQPVAAAKFQADLLNTKWYKGYIEPAREAEAIKYGDPATWEASVASATKIVRDNALAMGYDISPEQVATTVDMFLHKAGGKAEGLVGLPLAELKTYITSVGKLNASGGLAASGIANLKSIAADYGVAHLFGTDDSWFKSQQDAILKGTTTQAAVEQAIKTAAKSSYGALASQIDAGLSVKSVLAPYSNLYGNILEVDPNATDVSDPKFASNIFMQDPKDPSKQVLKPLWQYQQDLKKDPRWAYTNNARADLDATAHSVLTSLGLTY